MRKIREKGLAAVFAFLASISIIAVLVICIFLFARGIPAIHQIGFTKFVSGKIWKPGSDYYGIFVMIIGSPQPMASTNTMPNVSYRLGRTNA